MDHVIGVILGFITFFLFPIVEYLGKRKMSRNFGNPELWYLPAYGFRLVIRNIPNKIRLYNLKYRAKVVSSIPASSGSSVSTLDEVIIVDSEDFFLFPGYDQIILSFQLESIQGKVFFTHTNKLGKEHDSFDINNIDRVVCDYMAQIDNKFHFDLSIGKRVSISKNELKNFLDLISKNDVEQHMNLNDIYSVG